MRRLFANANYDFLGLRRKAYIISAILLVICVGAAVYGHVRHGSWINYGVDFTGGSFIHVAIEGPTVGEGEIRAVANTAAPGATVSAFGTGNEFIIRTPGTESDATTGSTARVVEALRAQFGAGSVTIERQEAVGAKVGGELQTRALIAIIVSMVATLIYLAFRFEWRFGAAAIIATAHDIMLTLGLLAVMRLEVSLTTVAAILTIVGYSLNDTIVVFDRIRENLLTARRADYIAVLNRSINETLPRTILTTATTCVTLLSLFLFGGVILRDFAMILLFGILVGTYSSAFIAAATLFDIEQRYPHAVKGMKRPPRAAAPRPSRV